MSSVGVWASSSRPVVLRRGNVVLFLPVLGAFGNVWRHF